jgi:hypothetical protein
VLHFTKTDTAGEVIFAGANQSANQFVQRVPSMGSGLFPTSPAVAHELAITTADE